QMESIIWLASQGSRWHKEVSMDGAKLPAVGYSTESAKPFNTQKTSKSSDSRRVLKVKRWSSRDSEMSATTPPSSCPKKTDAKSLALRNGMQPYTTRKDCRSRN